MHIPKYDKRYPSVADLKTRAKRRIPNFAFDYVDGAIDEEQCKQRNRDAFHGVQLTPRYLCDSSETKTAVSLFGKEYGMPFGVPPVGLGNMIWPGAEKALATAAQAHNVPYVLSTFSTTALEEIASYAPDVAWYQLYTPKDEKVMIDVLDRVKAAGFHALVVTLDIAVGAKRNRELKNNLQLPFRLTPNMVWQSLTHPRWTFETLKQGFPDFVNITRYKTDSDMPLSEFISDFMVHGVTKERIKAIRKHWDGPLILKGLQSRQNVLDAIELGVDGVIISNHGGRQLDASPSSVNSFCALPDLAHDKLTLMLDSGIRSGLDVVRGKALGAQMMFSGRSCFYSMGALGTQGAEQIMGIYTDEITRTLKQIGCDDVRTLDRSWITA